MHLAGLIYCGMLVLLIGIISSRFSPIIILVGAVYPAYLLYGLSIELLACESIRIDRYTVEVERKLFGFSISSEVFKTEDVTNVRIGVIRNWNAKRREYHGGRILFDEGKDTFSVGAGLEDHLAEELARAFRVRLESASNQ